MFICNYNQILLLQVAQADIHDYVPQHFLGHFKSEEDGARAYDRALLMRKKKDGCFNFPLSDYQESMQQGESFRYLSHNAVIPCAQKVAICFTASFDKQSRASAAAEVAN